jgi:hypothetical protein
MSAWDILKLKAVEAILKLPHLAYICLHQQTELDSLCLAGRELGIAPDGEIPISTAILRLVSRPSHSAVLPVHPSRGKASWMTYL